MEGHHPPVFLLFYRVRKESCLVSGEMYRLPRARRSGFWMSAVYRVVWENQLPITWGCGAHGNLPNLSRGWRPPVSWEAELGCSPSNKKMEMPLVSVGLLPKQPTVSSRNHFQKKTDQCTMVSIMFYFLKNKIDGGRESKTKPTKY